MKKKIAVVTGGFGQESGISYQSAETIFDNINTDLYEAHYIDINPEGWFYWDNDDKKLPVDKNDFSIVSNGHKIFFDAVLMGMHGTPGEDGKLQGYFDCLGIPYSCCNAATSAITFNKKYTTALAAAYGIATANSTVLYRSQPYTTDQVLSSLRLPLFVKPNNGGSSIATSRVDDASKLQEAIDLAFGADSEVIVEEFISGREFTIGVYRHNGRVVALPITEIISKNEFFDYKAKYEGASEEQTPANLEESKAAKIREAAMRLYDVFNCHGVVRADFIYDEGKDAPFLLEINTVPGQSAMSIVPQQVRAAGMNLKDFYSVLIEESFKK